MRVLRNPLPRSGSAAFLGMRGGCWPLSNGAHRPSLPRFRGMLWGRAGAWPIARDIRSDPAPVSLAWRLPRRTPVSAAAPTIHVDARRWLSLSMDWTVSLRLHPNAAAPNPVAAASRESGSSGRAARRAWQEPRFLVLSSSTSNSTSGSLPGRPGERADLRTGETRVSRAQEAFGLARPAPGDTRVFAVSRAETGRALTPVAARARLARRALARLKAEAMTLVCGSSLRAPLRTLALLTEAGSITSDAPPPGFARQDPLRRFASEGLLVTARSGSTQDRADSGPGLRQPPTFIRRTGSLWNGDVARKKTGARNGRPLSSPSRSRSPAPSPSDPTVAARAQVTGRKGASTPSLPLGSSAAGRVSTPAAIYRLAAPVPLPPAAIQPAGLGPDGSEPGILETSVGRLVDANLRRWEQQHLAPRRLAELTSRSLEQQLRRERERTGI